MLGSCNECWVGTEGPRKHDKLLSAVSPWASHLTSLPFSFSAGIFDNLTAVRPFFTLAYKTETSGKLYLYVTH